VKRNLIGYRVQDLSEPLVRIRVIVRAIWARYYLGFFSSGWKDCNDIWRCMESTWVELNLIQMSWSFLFDESGCATPRMGHPINSFSWVKCTYFLNVSVHHIIFRCGSELFENSHN
jgi:hypothetical protein